MDKFILNITASSGEFYQGDCESLTLPTSDGVYGVQAGHNPVLVALHMGLMHFTVNGEEHEVLVGDGIAEVTPTFVLLLVDSAERPEDIDRNRAEAARIRAAERLQHKQSMHEYYQTKIALDRAMQRLQTAAKYKRSRSLPVLSGGVSTFFRQEGLPLPHLRRGGLFFCFPLLTAVRQSDMILISIRNASDPIRRELLWKRKF